MNESELTALLRARTILEINGYEDLAEQITRVLKTELGQS